MSKERQRKRQRQRESRGGERERERERDIASQVRGALPGLPPRPPRHHPLPPLTARTSPLPTPSQWPPPPPQCADGRPDPANPATGPPPRGGVVGGVRQAGPACSGQVVRSAAARQGYARSRSLPARPGRPSGLRAGPCSSVCLEGLWRGNGSFTVRVASDLRCSNLLFLIRRPRLAVLVEAFMACLAKEVDNEYRLIHCISLHGLMHCISKRGRAGTNANTCTHIDN